MNSFIVVIFLLISIITIPEIKRKKAYCILTVVLICVLAWLGADKIRRDNNKEIIASAKKDSLSNDIKKLVEYRGSDSIRNSIFLKELRTNFNIAKDSVSNKPYYVKYENIVNRPRDVIFNQH